MFPIKLADKPNLEGHTLGEEEGNWKKEERTHGNWQISRCYMYHYIGLKIKV